MFDSPEGKTKGPADKTKLPAGTTSYIAWNALFLALVAVQLRIFEPEAPAFGLRVAVSVVLLVWFVQLANCAPSETPAPVLGRLRGRGSAADPVTRRILIWARRSFGVRGGWRGALTPMLLDRALLIAVIYPLGAVFVVWALSGSAGMIGETEVLAAQPAIWRRVAAICGLALSIHQAYQAARALREGRFGWFLARLALALAVAFAGAVAAAAAAAFAAAVAVAVALAVALAAAGAVALAVALAGAFAVAATAAAAVAATAAAAAAGAIWLESRLEKGAGLWVYGVNLAGLAMALAVVLAVQPWADVDTEARTLFLFLGILPLLNGLFDFLSYAVTLTLIRWGRRQGLWTLAFGLLDLACAALLFLGLGCCLIAVAAGINRLTGVVFVDIVAILGNLSDWRASGWIWLMVFSTLLPTAVHFLLAAIGSMSSQPRWLATWLVGVVDKAGHTPWAMIAAPLCMTGLTLGWLVLLSPFALVPMSLAGLVDVWWLGWVEPAARWYVGLFEGFAVWIGALPSP